MPCVSRGEKPTPYTLKYTLSYCELLSLCFSFLLLFYYIVVVWGEINVKVDVIFIFDVHFGVFNHSSVFSSLQPHGLEPTRLLCPWDFSGKDTGMGCHFLLQGNLPHPAIKPASPALQAGSFTT